MASKRALESYATITHEKEKKVGITRIYPGEIIENRLGKQKDIHISETVMEIHTTIVND